MADPPVRLDLLISGARILTLAGPRPRRGTAHGDLGVVARGSVGIADGRIAWVHDDGATNARPRAEADRTIDARGRVLMPGFVDAHTHACWAGDRLDEWERKQAGATYLELLAAGGGIMSTVRAVREAEEAELAEELTGRLRWMAAEGTTAVEVKSGYGLTTRDELKMLGAIHAAAERLPVTVRATALLGHAIDPDQPDFVGRVVHETLPAVHAAFPGVAVDAYCEQGAWSLEQTARLLAAARELGHPIRVHSDQFHELGATRWAVDHGAASVDHLEATSPRELEHLANSATCAVLLPCSGFHVDGRYADGRALIDAGAALVIATNWNPGSAPCGSMPMAIALAVRHLGITAAEAITACTTNAAALLGLDGAGQIVPGAHADLALLSHRDERMLGAAFGGRHVDLVLLGGAPLAGAR